MTQNPPKTLYLLDEMTVEEPYQPFAITDTLIHLASDQLMTIAHFWQLKDTVILGMKDTRVPNLKAGIKTLHAYGYQAIVRNSGGLAVVADEGILNFTLILPHSKKISIAQAYEIMHQIISESFSDGALKIEAFEVKDSYCPGEYDLSIQGKKFAGIAQRRIKNGVAIMIYLSIKGNQLTRGEMIRDFYAHSLATSMEQEDYPKVSPHSMDNLEDLLGISLTTTTVKNRMKESLQKILSISVDETSLSTYLDSDSLQNEFLHQLTKMEKRNQILHTK